MKHYLAFLRGVNVGGNGLIKMSELKDCLAAAGLVDVRTYIQSGNILFSSNSTDKKAIGVRIAEAIKKTFQLDVAIALFASEEWQKVIADAPKWWGKDQAWKHNILIIIQPADPLEIAELVGVLKPELESLQAGSGVLYQSIAITGVGRGATGSKLVSNAVYRKLTIRNFNTATKLAALLS